jgi:tetratricopeptide (TPR) repeat protein
MGNLGLAYMDAGKLDMALPLLDEAVERRRAKSGVDQPDMLKSINNLASAYWQAGKLDRSIPLFEQIVPVCKSKLGPHDPMTLLTMGNLGINYRDSGRLVDAIALLREVCDKLRNSPEPMDQSLAFFPSALADTYTRAGQFANAEPLLRDAVANQRKGGNRPETAGALAQLGANLLRQKKFADAEIVVRESLEIRTKSQPDAWPTFNVRSMLGAALLGQQKYAEAEPLLLSGYAGMKEREKAIPPAAKIRLAEAVERLVELYEKLGQKDKAAQWRKTHSTAKEKEKA